MRLIGLSVMALPTSRRERAVARVMGDDPGSYPDPVRRAAAHCASLVALAVGSDFFVCAPALSVPHSAGPHLSLRVLR